MTYDFQKPFSAKVVTYEAYVEAKLEAPKHLAPIAHDLHFEPRYDEFRGRTIWSLSWKPACRVGSDQCSGEPVTAPPRPEPQVQSSALPPPASCGRASQAGAFVSKEKAEDLPRTPPNLRGAPLLSLPLVLDGEIPRNQQSLGKILTRDGWFAAIVPFTGRSHTPSIASRRPHTHVHWLRSES
jgi:hypothetical protein